MNLSKARGLMGSVVSFQHTWLTSPKAKETFDGKPSKFPAHAVVLEFLEQTTLKACTWTLAIVETGEIIDGRHPLAKTMVRVTEYEELIPTLRDICDSNPTTPGAISKSHISLFHMFFFVG